MQRTTPIVSVGIPTYGNRASYLKEALSGVLDQTIKHIEVFVFNDGSTDETPEVVQSFQDERVTYLSSPPPGGLHANLNACLEVGTAPYLAICQDDDVWFPNNLERLLAAIEDRPGFAFAHGAFRWIDGEGRQLREWSAWGGYRKDAVETGSDFILKSMSAINRVNMSSAMLSRRVLDGVRFREADGVLCDTGLWMRLARRGSVAFVAEPLTALRFHTGTISVKVGINEADLRGPTMREIVLAQQAKARFLRESKYSRRQIRQHLRRSRRWARDELLRLVTHKTAPSRPVLETITLLAAAERVEPSLAFYPKAWRVVIASLAGERARARVRLLERHGHSRPR